MVPIGECNESKYGNCFSDYIHRPSDYEHESHIEKYEYYLDSSPLYKHELLSRIKLF